jgi:hypothetical protein
VIYERVVRPALYAAARGDPERVHDLALRALGWLGDRPLLSALVWRWYGSLLPRRTPVAFGLLAAAVVGAVVWWPLGWATGWLPSPWAGLSQAVAGAWLYFAAWYAAACWWWLVRQMMDGKVSAGGTA